MLRVQQVSNAVAVITTTVLINTVSGATTFSGEAAAQTPQGSATGSSAQAGATSIYTIHHILEGPHGRDSVLLGCESPQNISEKSMVVGVVEFNDKGSFADSSQLKAVLGCIAELRCKDTNGVIVLAFAHGWHHNASWDIEHDSGDSNFRDFRRIMMSLALREAERNEGARRVIGVYLGWRGQTVSGPLAPITEKLTFKSRLATAGRIGRSPALRHAIRAIIDTTKGDVSGAANILESPLIFAGHSMGALLIETGFLSLLRDANQLRASNRATPDSCATVRKAGDRILFPDLVLLLNAATDAQIAAETRRILEQQDMVREIKCGTLKYLAPLLISVTAEDDQATKLLFPIVKDGQKTEGHTKALFTHSVVRMAPGAVCKRKDAEHIMVDYYTQAWHCLRAPQVVNGRLARLAIDLPQEAENLRLSECHVRYRLKPIADRPTSSFWIFQVPSGLISGHNDVFNTRSNLFVMALAQTSGGVLSLASGWMDVFEPGQGQCSI